MPYIKDRDFTRVKELVETVKELSEKEEYFSIPDITSRAIKVMKKYLVEIEQVKKE